MARFTMHLFVHSFKITLVIAYSVNGMPGIKDDYDLTGICNLANLFSPDGYFEEYDNNLTFP